MTDQKQYEEIRCKDCDAVISFVKVINKEGLVKNIPINKEAAYLLCSSGEKTSDGKYLYAYKKGYVSHFSTCPAALERTAEYNKTHGKGQQAAPAAADQKADDLPPF